MADNRMQQDTVAVIDAQRAAIPLSRVKIDTPQQSFARGAARCNEIYLPIQFVEGFSIQDHVCDFILLSSSSMTSHMFALKTHEELEETKD